MKYRPPLGLSQPLDRSCAVEINLAYSCSLQAVPFVFLSRRAARVLYSALAASDPPRCILYAAAVSMCRPSPSPCPPQQLEHIVQGSKGRAAVRGSRANSSDLGGAHAAVRCRGASAFQV